MNRNPYNRIIPHPALNTKRKRDTYNTALDLKPLKCNDNALLVSLGTVGD